MYDQCWQAQPGIPAVDIATGTGDNHAGIAPIVNILSIQSHVAYGHVGNSAAVFPLQRLGHDVWPIHTVAFSNHLGYPTWRGRVHDVAEVAEIIDGLDRLGALAHCDAVLSGYLGDKGNG